MFNLQYRLAHVYVSSIVGSFVTPHSGCRWWVFGFTFCEIFFYYNAICKPPHWVAFHPQTAVSANTDAVSEKIQGLYKLVPEKNDCYTFEFNFRHSTSKRARQFLFMKVITKEKTSPLFVSQILCVQKAFLMFKIVQINHNIIWNPAALCCCLIILFVFRPVIVMVFFLITNCRHLIWIIKPGSIRLRFSCYVVWCYVLKTVIVIVILLITDCRPAQPFFPAAIRGSPWGNNR